MTYCLGILLPTGLVLASDSRTNAGVDQIASVRKLAIFESPGERVIVLGGGKNIYPEDVEMKYLASSDIADLAILERQGDLVAIVVPDLSAISKRRSTFLHSAQHQRPERLPPKPVRHLRWPPTA